MFAKIGSPFDLWVMDMREEAKRNEWGELVSTWTFGDTVSARFSNGTTKQTSLRAFERDMKGGFRKIKAETIKAEGITLHRFDNRYGVTVNGEDHLLDWREPMEDLFKILKATSAAS